MIIIKFEQLCMTFQFGKLKTNEKNTVAVDLKIIRITNIYLMYSTRVYKILYCIYMITCHRL